MLLHFSWVILYYISAGINLLGWRSTVCVSPHEAKRIGKPKGLESKQIKPNISNTMKQPFQHFLLLKNICALIYSSISIIAACLRSLPHEWLLSHSFMSASVNGHFTAILQQYEAWHSTNGFSRMNLSVLKRLEAQDGWVGLTSLKGFRWQHQEYCQLLNSLLCMGTGTWPSYCESSTLSGAKIVLKKTIKAGWLGGNSLRATDGRKLLLQRLGREYLIVNRG